MEVVRELVDTRIELIIEKCYEIMDDFLSTDLKGLETSEAKKIEIMMINATHIYSLYKNSELHPSIKEIELESKVIKVLLKTLNESDIISQIWTRRCVSILRELKKDTSKILSSIEIG